MGGYALTRNPTNTLLPDWRVALRAGGLGAQAGSYQGQTLNF